jgi:hypothetical protein
VKQGFETCAEPPSADHKIIPSGSHVSKAFTIVEAFFIWSALLLFLYKYDQLNRIKDAYTYNQVNLGSNLWSTTAPAVSDYEEHFSYDPNGNIMT